jgi:hypothetical protein
LQASDASLPKLAATIIFISLGPQPDFWRSIDGRSTIVSSAVLQGFRDELLAETASS